MSTMGEPPADGLNATATIDKGKGVEQPPSNVHATSSTEAAYDTQMVDTEQPDTTETPQPPPINPKLCGVCYKQPGKYKCPRCQMP